MKTYHFDWPGIVMGDVKVNDVTMPDEQEEELLLLVRRSTDVALVGSMIVKTDRAVPVNGTGLSDLPDTLFRVKAGGCVVVTRPAGQSGGWIRATLSNLVGDIHLTTRHPG